VPPNLDVRLVLLGHCDFASRCLKIVAPCVSSREGCQANYYHQNEKNYYSIHSRTMRFSDMLRASLQSANVCALCRNEVQGSSSKKVGGSTVSALRGSLVRSCRPQRGAFKLNFSSFWKPPGTHGVTIVQPDPNPHLNLSANPHFESADRRSSRLFAARQ
jgi:hypothetical protein